VERIYASAELVLVWPGEKENYQDVWVFRQTSYSTAELEEWCNSRDDIEFERIGSFAVLP
jgi:hypothetical protein